MAKMVPEFDYNDLRLATGDFSPSQLIGKGSHGCIYKAHLKSGQFVAVKKSSPGLQTLQDNSKLKNEINILSSLPEIHPNIVNLLGRSNYDTKNESFDVMVMEFMPNGSLHDLLHSNGGIATNSNWGKRVQFAIQIARAVKFLHGASPPVIHRDVKSANVLFDSEWNAKLADFGLAVTTRVDSVSPPAGTMGYLDPSYTEPRKLSTKTDVFSFGVVLLEILCCRKAIDVTRSPASIADWALQTKPETLESPWYVKSAVRRLLTLARKCVAPVDGDRPSIEAVLEEMERSWIVIERPMFLRWRKVVGMVVKRCAVVRNGAGDGGEIVVAPRRKMLKELLDDVTVM